MGKIKKLKIKSEPDSSDALEQFISASSKWTIHCSTTDHKFDASDKEFPDRQAVSLHLSQQGWEVNDGKLHCPICVLKEQNPSEKSRSKLLEKLLDDYITYDAMRVASILLDVDCSERYCL